MATLLFIGLGLAIMAFIALIVWGLVVYFREPDEVEDGTLVFNLMSYRARGHNFGVITHAEQGYKNRWKIKFAPKDNKPKDIYKKIPEEVEVIAGYKKFEPIPKFGSSNHRSFAIIYPPNAEDIPEYMRNTEFGKIAMSMAEQKNAEVTIEKAIREGSLRKDSIAEMLGDGELTAELFSRITNLLTEDVKKSMTKPEKDRIPSFDIQGNRRQ